MAVGIVICAVAMLAVITDQIWHSRTNRMVQQLQRTSRVRSATKFTAAELVGLPAPVAHYFRAVLHDGQGMIRFGRLTQQGHFLMRETAEGWRPFVATQYLATNPPAFVWDARIRMAPGININVRDAFLDGTGSMIGKLMGFWPVVAVEGTPEMAAAALHRYLAESVWFPSALLPSHGVEWTSLGQSRARATLKMGETAVWLDFSFGPDGLVTEVFTPARARDVDGRLVPTPWHGRFGSYAEHMGMRIPTVGEVEWQLPLGAQPYWRGKITEIDFAFWDD
jgi:hypothetical protein